MGNVTVKQRVCDLCGHGGGLIQECMLCGRDFCLLCERSTVFNTDICKECHERPDCRELHESFLQKYRRYAKLELVSLSNLPKFKPKICGRCGLAFRNLVVFRHSNKIYKTCDTCRKIIKGELHEPSER